MNPIDIPQLAEQYGPFIALLAAVIVAGGWTIRALWHRLNEQIDARFEDHKQHSSQMAENTKTLDQALRFIEGSGRG
ncbi:hypothetical protein [Sulfitobacter sp. 915]|uniref:hypothetical protein n=1 Tax=Sulfitobacter sp. 915 TaxID=3368558 RepID=UPI0037463243